VNEWALTDGGMLLGEEKRKNGKESTPTATSSTRSPAGI